MTHPATAAHSPLPVSDLEREHTAGLLRGHLIAGRLDLEEFEDRLEHTWQARFVEDLWEALRELPRQHERPPPPEWHLAPGLPRRLWRPLLRRHTCRRPAPPRAWL